MDEEDLTFGSRVKKLGDKVRYIDKIYKENRDEKEKRKK